MKTSVKQYIWPNKFIESIKGFDNEPINVRVQQDANEFFNLVCDKLETDLKETSNKHMLHDIYGGKLSHEIISMEQQFPYVSQREQEYLSINLEIKS